MTLSETYNAAIALPAYIEITLTLGGGDNFVPLEGGIAKVILSMGSRNDITYITDLTDREGKVRISKNSIEKSARQDRELFVQDYADLSSFAGKIVVRPMNIEQIEAAIHAHWMYSSHTTYPRKYKDNLMAALGKLIQERKRYTELRGDVSLPESVAPGSVNISAEILPITSK